MDTYNVDRFLDGQRFGYEYALNEIRNGKKEGHWIWYVFPQIKGLGHSPNSKYYGISGKEEAKAFLEHQILGKRLREITEALLSLEERDIHNVMSSVDCMKLRSSMTLFDLVSPKDVFNKVLEKYYGGQRDPLTLKMVNVKY